MLVKADINHVNMETDSEFFDLTIASSWTILLDADIGVPIG